MGGAVTLDEALKDARIREAVIADGERIVEEEVAAKGGLSGAALRAGYSAFKKVSPGIVKTALRRVLPLFVPVIDPHWVKAKHSGSPERYFRNHAETVADELLAVTDALADRSSHRVLVRIYRSLRGSARDHVIAGVPRIPALVARHLDPVSTARDPDPELG